MGFLSCNFQPVTAQPDATICCLKAARNNYNSPSADLPWNACGFGSEYAAGDNGTYLTGSYPPVLSTLSFCREACPGVGLSNLSEWLLLVLTWVLPAIALLFICSTGACGKKIVSQERQIFAPEKKNVLPLSQKFTRPVNSFLNDARGWLPNVIMEYIGILGDPASAIRGAFSEIALDVRVVHSLETAPHKQGFGETMRALAMVAGQTKFNPTAEVKLTNFVFSKGLLVALKTDPKAADLRKHLVEMNNYRSSLLRNDPDGYAVVKNLRKIMESTEEDFQEPLRICLEGFRTYLNKTPPTEPAFSSCLEDPEAFAKGLEDEQELSENFKRALDNFLGTPNPEKQEQPEANVIQNIPSEEGAEEYYDEKKTLALVKEQEDNVLGDTPNLTLFQRSHWARALKMGIKVGLQGRVDFMKALIVPVSLGLVATAGSFYTAYTALGDNDTAHSLAYGVWYSWIIVLAVASNCYIATANPGLVKLALQDQFILSEVTVPLRERAHNTRRWTTWLEAIDCDKPSSVPAETTEAPKRFFSTLIKPLSRSMSWILGLIFRKTPSPLFKPKGPKEHLNLIAHLILKQFLGWLCVAMTCACAASISYTTPTVGLGCRSFNHLLYGILTFTISIIAIVRTYLVYSNNFTAHVLFRALYVIGIGVNVFVLVFGTLFHLIGLYRSCLCSVLGVGPNFLLQMNSGTALDVANARRYWLPVGYMDFGAVWLICSFAIGCRGYIHYRLKLFGELDFMRGDGVR